MILQQILEMLRRDWRTAVKDIEAIQRVRDLHPATPNQVGPGYVCATCVDIDNSEPYPCPTIRALDGEQE